MKLLLKTQAEDNDLVDLLINSAKEHMQIGSFDIIKCFIEYKNGGDNVQKYTLLQSIIKKCSYPSKKQIDAIKYIAFTNDLTKNNNTMSVLPNNKSYNNVKEVVKVVLDACIYQGIRLNKVFFK
ncbi:hypothetical protein [Wolbachia endosymbiont of Pentidionis agamae]|uniref:hypothetical protein n=1 Tax=Wolbachia endosymbiont of Pentidionis agamae TaxID=3110435 RepID=UPI002FCF8FC8